MVKNPETTSRWQRAKEAHWDKRIHVETRLEHSGPDSGNGVFALRFLGVGMILLGGVMFCHNFDARPLLSVTQEAIAESLMFGTAIALVRLPKTAGVIAGTIAGAKELVSKPQTT